MTQILRVGDPLQGLLFLLYSQRVGAQMKLWKNWLAALALVVIGVLTTAVEGDATFLVVTLVFSVSLLRAKVPWFA